MRDLMLVIEVNEIGLEVSGRSRVRLEQRL
jgi:hypothetical protein